MKKCSKCGIEKGENEFYKRKNSVDGFNSWCKLCSCYKSLKWRKNNPNKVYNSHKLWVKNNPKKARERTNRWNLKNINKYKNYKKVWNDSYTLYNSYFDKLSTYEECRQDPNNVELLQVKCKNCGKWFNPNNLQIRCRLDSLINKRFGNFYLYCSSNCKYLFKYNLTIERYSEYKNYRRRSNMIFRKIVKQFGWFINPKELPRGIGKNKYHIDHIYSVLDGFRNNIPIEVINNPFNLRMLDSLKNRIKLDRSDITINELMEDYDFYKNNY